MNATMLHRRFRWLSLAAALIVLVLLLLWLASAPLLALVVQRELQRAGWVEASLAGVSINFSGVTIEQVRLAPGDAIVLEDLHARIGRAGVEHLMVSRLRARAEVAADGTLVLPGGEPAMPGSELAMPGGEPPDGRLPFDRLPAGGIDLELADIRLATPLGDAGFSLGDVSLRRTAAGAELSGHYRLEHDMARFEGTASMALGEDGSLHGRLAVERGRVEAPGFSAGGLGGALTMEGAAAASPAFAVNLTTDDVTLAGTATGPLTLAARWQDGAARFDLASTDARIADATAEGWFVLADDTSSLGLSALIRFNDAPAGGQLALDAELSGGVHQGLSGRLRLNGDGLSAPGRYADGRIAFEAAVEGDLERLRFTAADPWTLAFRPAAALLPHGMQTLAGEEMVIGISPRDGEPHALQFVRAEHAARLTGAMDITAGQSGLHAPAEVTATWAGQARLAAHVSDLTARHLPWESLSIDVEAFEGTATQAPDEWQVSGAGTLRAVGSAGGADFERLTVHWSGTVTGTPAGVAAVPSDCIAWTVGSVAVAGVELRDVTPPCVASAGGQALLSYDTVRRRTRFDVSMDEAPLEARVVIPEWETPVSGIAPALRLTGILTDVGVETAALELSGGALALPREQVGMRGLTGSAQLSGATVVASALNIAAIESLSTPPVWTPLGLEVSTSGADDGLAFDAVLSDRLGVLVLEATGRYQDDRASSQIRLHPLRFTPGARQPGDLLPVLGDHVQDASGTIEFEGEALWDGDGWRSSGTLSLQDVGATLGGVAVAGVSTRTELDSLLPPVTLPGQRASLDELALGVPLEDGLVVYDIDADGRIAVRSLEFDFAGGRLYSEPFIVDSAAMHDIGFTLLAEEVDLARVLELAGIEGLQGTGVVSGRVPVRWTERGFELDRGVLAAETSGVLRYAPQQLPEFLQGDDLRSSMLREVLTNFHYEELSMSVAGDSGDSEGQRLTLTARGANPDFLEGHPIELNVNFEGALLGAVRSAVDVSGAAEIQEMLEQQERGNEETTQ